MKLSFIVLCCALVLPLGCKKGQGGDKSSKSESKAKEGATAKDDKDDGKSTAGTPCEAYAEKLCEVVDEKSRTCQSVKTVTGLMPEKACKAGMADIEFSKKKLEEKRKTCDELVEKLCADIGPDTKTCDMVKNQTSKFPPERCESMMKQYPRLVEDLKRREAANKPLDAEQQKLIASGDGPATGPADAKVTLVEFSDFECPYCSRAANAVNEVKKKYGDKIRLVFKQFPLSFHKNAHLASQAALAANEQGKFWEYHDKLFENQRALKRPELEKYAKELGLNLPKFKKALDTEKYKKQVDDEIEQGKKVHVSGTPTLFLNGERVQNPTDAEAIGKEIDKKLGS